MDDYMKGYLYESESRYKTIAEMFVVATDKYADKSALGYKERSWKTYSFGEVRSLVEKMSGGLKEIGLNFGDHAAIIANNCPWWAMADYAITFSKGVTVTVYPTLTSKQIKWIVQHSESRFLFCGSKEIVEKVLPMLDDLQKVEKIIVMDNDPIDHPSVITMSELLKVGSSYVRKHPTDFKECALSIKSDDLLTIIYTSGTSGLPKGVMLTHKNLISNIEGALRILYVDEDDTFLSFLPLSHSLERMAGHFLPFYIGATIYYAESIDTVGDNMQGVRPTVMISVPRLYEKMYAKVIDSICEGAKIKQKIFWWAVNVGKKAAKRRHRQSRIGLILKMKLKVANKLVFSQLKGAIGGRIRFFVSGGAPLSREIGEFFEAAGITILEGYGLTETSPVVSVNLLEKYKYSTVGPPLPNVKAKIAEDGEIIVSGPNVMKGYYKDEEATKEVIDSNGWLYTGDIGEIDRDGYLKITDRKKDLIVTSGGKNVAPQPLENYLTTSKWIEQAVIIGDKRKFVSAIIVPAFSNLESWAKEKGLQWENREKLIQLQKVQKLYENIVEESMEGFAQFEKVKRFVLLPKEFTIEEGTLTPSLKIVRHAVLEKYSDLIDEIYERAEA
jgi:long-chain acyl-CoA synthetase